MQYGMFTKSGDAAVHKIVTEALVLAGLDGPSNAAEQAWNWALGELDALARDPAFEEATDTAVRECVYIEVML
ncbi:hypothetical protein N9993_01480 [bacterium]|jgi:hypothetical protein|nr:hypothetical protein [bacterium]